LNKQGEELFEIQEGTTSKVEAQINLLQNSLKDREIYVAVIGHGIGGKYIPIMARLAKARRWSKRGQTCLSSPNLTAIHNE